MKKNAVKKLALSRETIRELEHDELAAAGGGAGLPTGILSLPASACPCISMGARICSQDSC